MPQYLSTDPQAGRKKYLSIDPKAGNRKNISLGIVSASEPSTRLGGAMKHLFSEEPATVGALGMGAALGAPLLGVGATISGIAGAAAPAIGHILTRGVRAATGQSQKPITGEELTDILTGPATQYGLGAGARLVGKGISKIKPSTLKEGMGAIGALVGHSALPGFGTLGGYFAGRRFSPLVAKAAESARHTRQATGAVEEIGGRIKQKLGQLFSGQASKPISGAPTLLTSLEPFISKSKREIVANFTDNDILRLADELGVSPIRIREAVITGRRGAEQGYRSEAEMRKHLKDLLEKE